MEDSCKWLHILFSPFQKKLICIYWEKREKRSLLNRACKSALGDSFATPANYIAKYNANYIALLKVLPKTYWLYIYE